MGLTVSVRGGLPLPGLRAHRPPARVCGGEPGVRWGEAALQLGFLPQPLCTAHTQPARPENSITPRPCVELPGRGLKARGLESPERGSKSQAERLGERWLLSLGLRFLLHKAVPSSRVPPPGPSPAPSGARGGAGRGGGSLAASRGLGVQPAPSALHSSGR